MFQSMAQSSISTLYSCELFTSEIIFIQGRNPTDKSTMQSEIYSKCNVQRTLYIVHPRKGYTPQF